MKSDPENERLLDDILAEESEPGFRNALFERTILAVRRRRRLRRAAKAGSVIAALAIVVLLSSRYFPTRPVAMVHKAGPPGTYVLVRTEPLPKSEIVLTQPLAAIHQIS